MGQTDLLRSTSVLFAIAFALSLVKDRYFNRWPRWEPLFLGLKYGLIAMLGIMSPLVITEGVRYDARAPFVGMAGLFGGWPAAAVAVILPLIYRGYAGGIGVLPGLLSIVAGAALGLLFRFHFSRLKRLPTWMELMGMGVIYSVESLIWSALLPQPIRSLIIEDNGVAITAVYMLATLIFGAYEIQDIRRREQNRVLEANQRLLESAERVGQFGFWMVNPDTMEVRMSTRLQETLAGHPISGPLDFAAGVVRYVHPDDREKVALALQAAIRGHIPDPIQFRVIQAGGAERLVWTHYIGTNWIENSPWIMGLMHDVTDTSRLFEQMSHSARLATLGEMAASIGHEISNPLAVARMNADRLETRIQGGLGNDEKSRELVRKLAQRLDAIASLVRSITSFARSDSDAKRPVVLHNSIHEAVDFFRDLTAGDVPEIDLHLEAERSFVLGSPIRFQQILFNLLNNARQATEGKPDARVTISSTNIGNAIVVSVRDNGRGIPPDIRPRIFTPFFTTKKPGQGTGLGLSITSSLIRDLGGAIEVDSEPGQGAEFRITLPIAHPGTATATPIGVASPINQISGAKMSMAPHPTEDRGPISPH